jgi:hypothetical protein
MAGTFRFSHSKFGFAMSLILAGLGAYLMWMHTGHVLAAVPYVVLLAVPVSARLARAQGRIPLTWPVASSKYLTIPLAIVALLISAPSRVEESLVTSKSLTPEIALDLARAALADGQAYRLFS